MKNISNSKARSSVQNREEFNGSNTFGRQIGDVYVVTSYGNHFPLFVFKGGKWFANCEKYSVSTSKHFSQLHPLGETIPMSTKELQALY